jgi:hypothetical protein
MPQHPEARVRRAVRVLAMVADLHKRGYQRLRVMPFMSPSGAYWRCWIGPAKFFYRNHGAILRGDLSLDDEVQARATIAGYTSGQENEYFGWKDAQMNDARSLADKFLNRFHVVADSGHGWDYPYAGWYQRLLGLAEAGWLPIVLSDYNEVSYERIPLEYVGLKERRVDQEKTPRLPLPPPGELQEDYGD